MLAKANGLHERTIETCRRWGILNEVIKRGFPQDLPGDSVYSTLTAAICTYFGGAKANYRYSAYALRREVVA